MFLGENSLREFSEFIGVKFFLMKQNLFGGTFWEIPGKLGGSKVVFLEKNQNNSMDARLLRLMHRYANLNFKKSVELGLHPNVHPGQMPVLGMHHEKEGVSLREKAQELQVKPPTVTVTVKRLEKVGLVCKRPDETDLRVTRIYLTEKGRNISSELRQSLEENEQIMMKGFSEEEKAQLRSFLDRMTQNLIEAGAKEFHPEMDEEIIKKF